MRENVIIIDYGSQYSQLIWRRVRELGVHAEMVSFASAEKVLAKSRPAAIILSGGPMSVEDPGSPGLPPIIKELKAPVLGICYGMHLLAKELGGKTTKDQTREYGPALLQKGKDSPLWEGIGTWPTTVLMSHGDRVTRVPPGFSIIASTDDLDIAAMSDGKRIFALQFHPETQHSQEGERILANFLFKIAGLKGGFDLKAFIRESLDKIAAEVGEGQVLLALSGGVDSTVVASLLHKAIPGRLHCVFVNNGLLRLGEVESVLKNMAEMMPGLEVRLVDAADLFLRHLKGITEPEEKRKIIGRTFIEVFEEAAGKIDNLEFLAQGTIYPDVVESMSSSGTVIKSHHNVGGLPENMRLRLIEPLRDLFKDEVRELGRELGLSDKLLNRHPFPGPGLAVRILGEVNARRLEILRAADKIVREELEGCGWSEKVWQGFAVLLPVAAVGVRGDSRSYEDVVAVRVVDSVDAMTANWSRLPYEALSRISGRIVNEVPGVGRVVYDITDKPPGTIEWE